MKTRAHWYVWDLPENRPKRECRTCKEIKDLDKGFGKVNMYDTYKDGNRRYYVHIRLDCKNCYAKKIKEKRYKKFLERGQDKLHKILMG